MESVWEMLLIGGSSLEDLTSIKGTLKFQILFKFDDFQGFSPNGTVTFWPWNRGIREDQKRPKSVKFE